MRRIIFILFLLSNITESTAQTGSWQVLQASPNQVGYRHDDIFFLNDSIGWLVNHDGYIYRTNNRGILWNQQFHKPTVYFRCVGFADSLNGWAGNLGAQSWGGSTDTNCLYQTHDGGATWNPVSNISGPKPKGLCGIYVLDSLHIYAVGRIEGPVHFMKSSDGGNSWTSQDMSAWCGDLVDVRFFSADTGFIVGGTNSDFYLSHGIILRTVDGGTTWQTAYTTVQDSTWCWKQTSPSANTSYASLQQLTGPVYFLNSVDRGITWNENLVTNSPYFCQGIGFLNDSVGWIGGDFNNSISYGTVDAGSTWSIVNIGYPINRFRFTSDSTGYSCGEKVYRYSPVATGYPTETIPDKNYSFSLISSNPTGPTAAIEFSIPSNQEVEISLYDLPGRKIKTLVQSTTVAGKHRLTFELPTTINGIFFCSFRAGDFSKIITFVGLRH